MRLSGHQHRGWTTGLQTAHQRSRRPRVTSNRAFSLIDTLVSMSVVFVLITLLMPSLRNAQEMARRVVCASNLRQITIGVALYADEQGGVLPPSVFLRPQGVFGSRGIQSDEMVTLRLDNPFGGLFGQEWDGLGFLYSAEYLPAPKLYYCPSHAGEHRYSRYESVWGGQGAIVGNFHYRGVGPNGTSILAAIEPSTSAILADGLRRQSDFNHRHGINVALVDLSVRWLPDPHGDLKRLLPTASTSSASGSAEGNAAVQQAWRWIDHAIKEPD